METFYSIVPVFVWNRITTKHEINHFFSILLIYSWHNINDIFLNTLKYKQLIRILMHIVQCLHRNEKFRTAQSHTSISPTEIPCSFNTFHGFNLIYILNLFTLENTDTIRKFKNMFWNSRTHHLNARIKHNRKILIHKTKVQKF